MKVLRPGKREAGLDPKFYDEVVGSKATQDIEKDEGISWDSVEINR